MYLLDFVMEAFQLKLQFHKELIIILEARVEYFSKAVFIGHCLSFSSLHGVNSM